VINKNKHGKNVDAAVANCNSVAFVSPGARMESSLMLPLTDFGPRTRENERLARHSFEISHEELARILTATKATQKELDHIFSDDSDALSGSETFEYKHKREADTLESDDSLETDILSQSTLYRYGEGEATGSCSVRWWSMASGGKELIRCHALSYSQ
jgi:hypothetical protein